MHVILRSKSESGVGNFATVGVGERWGLDISSSDSATLVLSTAVLKKVLILVKHVLATHSQLLLPHVRSGTVAEYRDVER